MLRVYGSAARLKSTCTCFVGDDHEGGGDGHASSIKDPGDDHDGGGDDHS